MESPTCPIPNTHRRLSQAHYLWHQALGVYDDPEPFRANLNSTIEALRNVTFMLQSEKGAVPDFDSWYETWREAMKADAVMSWLHDARTTVVHKADLETTSTAVAMVHNNLTLATTKVDVPPMMPTVLVAENVVQSVPEPFASQRRDLLISVERCWCDSNLPSWELLDALSHAYGFLSQIVAEAHQKAGASFETRDHEGRVHRGPGGRLPCMITTAELRTVRVELTTGLVLTSRRTEIPLDPADIPSLEARYGPPPAPIESSEDPFRFAEALVPLAKKVLRTDGYHHRLIHIRTPQGWVLRGVDASDRGQKYALLRMVANEIKSLQGDAIIDIGEAWMTPQDEVKAGILPEKSTSRKEVLVVAVATADGRFRGYDTVFSRDASGSIVLEETEVRDGPMPTYMAPFCQIWGLPIPRASELGDV